MKLILFFWEYKPIYFNQLDAIYNEIKFTDSIFQPSKNYINKYGNIKEELDKSVKKVIDIDVKNEIIELKQEEQNLPGTIPSINLMIINFIKEKNKQGIEFVSLKDIYVELENQIKNKKLESKYKIDTFRNTIRGELNTNELSSEHKNNKKLFIRSSEKNGYYKLTENGENYKGR